MNGVRRLICLLAKSVLDAQDKNFKIEKISKKIDAKKEELAGLKM